LTDSEQLVLDYSHYVEVVDQEECACFSRFVPDLTAEADRRGVRRDGLFRFFSGDLGKQIVEYQEERLQLFRDVEYDEKCPYCQTMLDTVHESNREINSVFGRIVVRLCPKCGWWESSDECSLEENQETRWYRSREVRRRALLREYSVGGSEVPLQYLHKHISRHPNALSYVSPRRLEELVGKAFSEVMNCEAIHIGGPNDGGIDLILIDGERRYVVQVKRRSTDAAECVRGVREFVGAMVLQGYLNGLFVTTAPRFSPPAERTARLAKKRNLVESISLIDSSRLFDICKLTANRIPPAWKHFALTKSDPTFDFGEESYFCFSTHKRSGFK
jgi:hypothetical protein